MDKPYGKEMVNGGNDDNTPGGNAGEESGFFEEQPPGAAAGGKSPGRPGFLEIVYGVLFEPAKTMAAMAPKPPLAQAFLAVTLLSLAGSAMLSLTLYRLAGGFWGPALKYGADAFWRAFLPAGMILGLFWGYVKWAAWGAFLHLAAELLGGRGTARGVLAAVGFAAIPSLFLVPIQLLASRIENSHAAAVILFLAGLTVTIWTVTLLAIALRELHGISVLRALLAVFSPLLAVFVLVVMLFMAFGAAAFLIPSGVPHFPI